MIIRKGERIRSGGGGGNRSITFFMLICNISFASYLLHKQSQFNSSCNNKHNLKTKRAINPTIKHSPNNKPDDPYVLARSQSFGFFYDIPSDQWRLSQQLYNEHDNHRFPQYPLTYNPRAKQHQSDPKLWLSRNNHKGYSSYDAWYQNNYEPNFSCQHERRVGIPMNGDGSKWVCDPHRIKKLAEARKEQDPDSPGCVIYSIGSSGDFTFELGMQKVVGVGTCEYHIFDFGDYANDIPKELKRAHYHQWGLMKQKERGMFDRGPYPGEEYYGLLDTIKLLRHDRLDVIDIFKIDCEKCEWETYHDWLADGIPMLHQIQVELHWAPTDEDAGAIDFFNTFERAGYLRFHKEPNIQWGPENIEYAFVKVEKTFMEGKVIA